MKHATPLPAVQAKQTKQTKSGFFQRKILPCLPRSLFGRNLLLLAILILLAEAGLGILLIVEVQQPRLQIAQELALRRAQQNRNWLLGIDHASRLAWQRQTAPDHPAKDAPSGEIPLQYRRAASFMHNLQQQLGTDYKLHWQAPAARLWLQTAIGQERYWLELDTSALQTKLPAMFIILGLATGLLALLGAGFISRRINQPLQQLAQHALTLGQGQNTTAAFSPEQSAALPSEIAQLAHAMQAMAEDLQRAENERVLMLAGVSHDLRTPLTKLRLAIEILQQSGNEEDDLLRGMVKHIQTADKVIAQFIAYARGTSDEAQQEIELCTLLAELVAESRHSLPPDQADYLALSLPVQPQYYVCHPVALSRAISNLLENALRYAPPQQAGALHITLEHDQISQQYRISIADRGPGIPAEDLATVRRAFMRAQANAHQTAGTGLGLAIVERIAQLHGGSLLLQQRSGGGLQATLELPVR